MPRISVIVPVYKVEPYLHRCVDSILAQTYQDFELILVDDGSPDNCGKTCDEYAEKDARIHVIHQKNGGLSAARNAGLKLAQGDYICFLDSDDFIDNTLFGSAVEAMKNSDMVTINCRLIDEEGIETGFLSFPSETINILAEIDRFKFLATDYFDFRVGFAVWLHFYRKKIIDENRIVFEDNRMVFAEDMFFTFCYLLHANLVDCIPGIYYNYTQRSSSIMGTQTTNYNIGRINELSKALKNYLFAQKGLEVFKKNYPIIHLQVMSNVLIRAKKNNPELGLPEIRKILLHEISDWEYFKNECLEVKKCLSMFGRTIGRLLSRKMFYEYKYYADGKYSSIILLKLVDWLIKTRKKGKFGIVN